MARNPSYTFTQTRVDRSGEKARISFNVQDGQFDTEAPEEAAWLTAIGTVCDGTVISGQLSTVTRVSNVSHSEAGQREEKWLLIYEDTTTHVQYTMDLPCRKASVQPPVNTDLVDLAVAPWPAFKTAFENGAVKSPDGGAVQLNAVRLVGRNV